MYWKPFAHSDVQPYTLTVCLFKINFKTFDLPSPIIAYLQRRHKFPKSENLNQNWRRRRRPPALLPCPWSCRSPRKVLNLKFPWKILKSSEIIKKSTELSFSQLEARIIFLFAVHIAMWPKSHWRNDDRDDHDRRDARSSNVHHRRRHNRRHRTLDP